MFVRLQQFLILQSYFYLFFLGQNNHVKVAVVADPQVSFPANIISSNCAKTPVIAHTK